MRKLLLAALVLAGMGLRARPLTANRFHPDEALYATFGRLIATGRDPWLASVVADKPPVAYYTIGSSLYLFGGSEFAARLPSLAASALSLPLLYAAARRLYDRRTAEIALAVFALSPFPISFAATAFIDPLQVAFLLWATAQAARGQPIWAGVAAGLALATKQTSVAFLPLLAWLVWRQRAAGWRGLGLCLAPIALAVALSFAWDAGRQASIGFWRQGYSDNVPGGLALPGELWPRLREVGRLLAHVTASPAANLAGLTGLAALLFRGARPVDFGLVAFAAIYAGAYWLLDFNLWDRYFLALVPFLCLMLARGLLWLATRLRPRWRWAAAPVLAALLVPPALTAARSGFALGGDHGAYDGIDAVARYLSDKPRGDVLYDHWLSWELRYYLGDAPIYLVWVSGPRALTADLLAFGRTSPRYFVSPSWESDSALQAGARAAGFAFEPVYTTTRRDGSTSFTVYRLAPVTADKP